MCLTFMYTLFALLTCAYCIQANDYFSSIAGLEQLLQTEQILLKELRTQLDVTKRHVGTLESELQTIETEHVIAAQDTENYITNPVNIYRLMKRLYMDWDQLIFRVQQMAKDIDFHEQIQVRRSALNFPSQEDIDGAALALVRLQSTYKLDVAQMAAGILNGIKYGSDMNWQDCFILSQQLFELEDYNNTRVWLRESMERLRKQTQHSAPPEAITLNKMERVAKDLFQLGDFDTAYELSQRVLEYDPQRERNWHLGDKTTMQVNKYGEEILLPKQSNLYKSSGEFSQYEKVCRGEITASAAQQRQLRCHLTSNGQPYRLLAPLKFEEHNLDPLVLTFHDAISTHKMDTIKEMAVPRMQRSTVNAPNADRKQISWFRVSKNAWLPYETHPYMLQMLRDIQHATGLDMTYCEQLQVANYGVGGHYEPHWDFFRDESLYPEEEGNRIATAIFYLSDVEQGGATAFPFLNFAVKPQKGNVLFWYNLHRSSDKDFRTKHAGCPVLKGSKWIANIWIHERTQVFTRPCNIYRDNEISLDYEIIK